MKFCLVTPSFYRDHERCMLLCDSIERYSPPELEHYVIVSQQDEALFRASLRPRTQLLIQEKIVPGNYWNFPFFKGWRFSLYTLPIRGWIWQQLVKLCLPLVIESEAFLLLDSDTFFTNHFDPQTLIRNGQIPLFVEDQDFYESNSDTQRWAAISRSILGLPELKSPSRLGYVSCYSYWRRDIVLQLHSHIKKISKSNSFIPSLANHSTFSEYALYGTFVDEIIGRNLSGHYAYEDDIVHAYWLDKPLNQQSISEFRNSKKDPTPLTMINAKSETPISLIRSEFDFT